MSSRNAFPMRNALIRVAAPVATGTLFLANSMAATPALDAKAIGEASGASAAATPDGVVKIGWPRTDVLRAA